MRLGQPLARHAELRYSTRYFHRVRKDVVCRCVPKLSLVHSLVLIGRLGFLKAACLLLLESRLVELDDSALVMVDSLAAVLRHLVAFGV